MRVRNVWNLNLALFNSLHARFPQSDLLKGWPICFNMVITAPKKDSVYPKNCMEIFLHNVKPKVQKQLIYHREAGIPLVTNSNCWWCTKSEWVMNTYIAASEVQKDTDLCDQWAATWQMKCSVDRYRVIEMNLQNNQPNIRKM